MSSLGTLIGIAGAMFLGDKWRILDPIAAIVVSILIIKSGYDIVRPCISELLEASLPEDKEKGIVRLAMSVPGILSIHNLRTRRIGNGIAVDLHAKMDGGLTLNEAHEKATAAENAIKQKEAGLIQGTIQPPKVKYCINAGNWQEASRMFSQMFADCCPSKKNSCCS